MKAKNQKQLFRIFVSTCMKCGDNEQKSKPKVKKKNTKQSENNHGPLQKLKVRSGALEKQASSADQSHQESNQPCALCRNLENGKLVDNSVDNNEPTISKSRSAFDLSRRLYLLFYCIDYRNYKIMTSYQLLLNDYNYFESIHIDHEINVSYLKAINVFKPGTQHRF